MGKHQDSKPVILFDANPLVGNKSGIGQYTQRFIDAIAKDYGNDFVIKAYYFNFLGLKKVTDLPATDKVHYIVVKFLPTKLINILHRFRLQLPLEFILGFQKFDYIIFNNFVAVPTLRNVPYAVTIHDMCFEDFPEFISGGNRLYLHRFVGKSVANASLVLAISEFTKDRIGYYYGEAAQNRTLVLPIPFEEPSVAGRVSAQARKLADTPYILYVGTLEPRKNIVALIYGLAAASEDIRKKYRLILVGGLGWDKELLDKALAETKDRITVIKTGYLSDTDRGHLYKNADLVAYLSHYEGFGMQAWEAMYYHRKLLLSDIPVFREVAGDYATYCDKDDPKAIAHGIAAALSKQSKGTVPTRTWSDNANTIATQIREQLAD